MFTEGVIKLGLRDIDWAQAGASLAQVDDEDQAAFFQAFVRECLTWGPDTKRRAASVIYK